MERTRLISKIVGPVLLLRAVSIVIDRQHFLEMNRGLETEIGTVSFSMFPIALFMTCTALAILHRDISSLAGILIRLMAWGGIIKASLLIVFPHLLASKAEFVEKVGFLNVVLAVCCMVGAYFTWFGYFRSPDSDLSEADSS